MRKTDNRIFIQELEKNSILDSCTCIFSCVRVHINREKTKQQQNNWSSYRLTTTENKRQPS